jgi:endonuclease/exonuclease/phosphatase family metal-dependent hydrolase
VSFNIRNCTAPDGPNHWDHRRELVVRTLNAHDADLIGLQEARFPQVRFLRDQLAAYHCVGIGRDNGRDDHDAAGEFAAIFFRRHRFDLLTEGHFWLSETPDVPGSKGWDAALPRIVSWVRLHDRHTGRTMRFLNTHFEWEGIRARHESASLLRAHIGAIAAHEPVIVVGDFNDNEESETYRRFFHSNGSPSAGPAPCDCHLNLQSQPTDDDGTYHAFTGRSHRKRIDWIITRGPITPLLAAIDRRDFAGRYPSDHFPVVAELDLA